MIVSSFNQSALPEHEALHEAQLASPPANLPTSSEASFSHGSLPPSITSAMKACFEAAGSLFGIPPGLHIEHLHLVELTDSSAVAALHIIVINRKLRF